MMTPKCDCLLDFGLSELCSVTTTNGAELPLTGKGTKAFQGVHRTVLVPEVHCVPDLAQPLFSVPEVYDQGGKVAFHTDSVGVLIRSGGSWWLSVHILCRGKFS